MSEEFNLSNKIDNWEADGSGLLLVSDVKEFIRRLKGHLSYHIWKDDVNYIPWDIFLEEIDALAGEKLI